MSKGNKTSTGFVRPVADKVLIKRVRRAGMWCRTEFVNGKQKQTWHEQRPEAQPND